MKKNKFRLGQVTAFAGSLCAKLTDLRRFASLLLIAILPSLITHADAQNKKRQLEDDDDDIVILSVRTPRVNISSPATNAVFQAPITATNNITIDAVVSIRRSPVSQVQVYDGTTLLGTGALVAGTTTVVGPRVTATYRYTWTNAPAGDRSIWARALTTDGGIGSSLPVKIVVNQQPNVNLLVPTSGQVVLPGQSITLTAVASDPDDSISRVDLLINGANIGAGTLSGGQYNRVWSSPTGGNFTAAATALDTRGGSTTTAPVSFVVNIPPTVTLASVPANIATANAAVALTATATDSDGTISKVEFFVNNALVSTLNAPTSGSNFVYNWTPSLAGVYSIKAVATDNRGTPTTSNILSVTVCGVPQVTITAPNANQLFVVPAAVPASVNATQAQAACGTIAKVEFFNGAATTPLATVTTGTSPFTYSWTGLTGSVNPYTLRVRATDTRGLVSTDTSVNFVMNAAPTTAITVPLNNAAVSLGAVTVTATAADSDGTIAQVELYDGATLIQTLTAPNSGANFNFTWTPTTPGVHPLTTKAKDNRGTITTSAVVNVNICGAPTLTITAPTANQQFTAPATVPVSSTASQPTAGCGTITKVEYFNNTATTALATVTTPTAGAYPYSWANLAGSATNYTLRARATDSRGLISEKTVAFIVNALPTVSISTPANNAVLDVGTASTITVAAADSDGTITKVEFFDGATLLSTLNSPNAAPNFTYSWNPSVAGNHTLTAKATDNRGGVATSAVITINACAIPTVTLTSPTAGANFPPVAPATTVTIALAATAPVPAAGCGTISKVEFLSGATVVNSDATTPYAFSQPNVGTGAYSYSARVTTSRGKTGVSPAVAVTVNVLPKVTLTAVCSTTPCNPPATVNLTATPTDTDGTITKVDFYMGGVLQGSKPNAPWTFAVPNLPSGTKSFTVIATDNLGGTSVPMVNPATVRVNSPPVVSVVSGTCASGATCQAPTAATLTATATDDVNVTQVEFYNNNNATLLGLGTKSGNNWTWTGNDYRGGVNTVTAKAYDAEGLTTVSAPYTLTIGTPVLVTHNILCSTLNARLGEPPTGGPQQEYLTCQGTSLPLTLSAAISAYSGTVARVDYCNGLNANGTCQSLMASSTTGPTFVAQYVTGATQYAMSVRAVAFSPNGSIIGTSNLTGLTLNPPPVFTGFTAVCSANPCKVGDTVSVNATVTDANGGTITKVFFFADNGSAIEDIAAPYSATYPVLSAGPHIYTAAAYDNQGGLTLSVERTVVVPVPPSIQPGTSALSVTPGGTATMDVVAIDEAAGLKTEMFFDGATTATKTCTNQASGAVCTGTWTAPATPVAARLVPVKIVVTDATGLSVTETRFVAITLDPSATEVDYGLATSTLGTTAGALQIGDSGAATYAIPIAVPPGANGMQPDIALAYNSQGGDGVLGVGWTLTGYSAIARCPKTYAQDGVREGIKYDAPATDAYCLDGQRLIPISANKNPTSGTVEYRTEIDSYSKIESYPADQGQFLGIGSWKIWAKSGRIFDYGSNYKILSRGYGQAFDDAGVPVRSNSIKVWPVDRVADRFGNYISYEYQSSNADTFYGTAAFRGTGATTAIAPFPYSEFWPSRILTYNASSEPLGDVVFDTVTRSAGQETFFDSGAGESRLSKRISRILVRAHDGSTLTPVRSYLLGYAQSAGSNRPNLTSVQECFGEVTVASSSCLTKTSFDWSSPVTVDPLASETQFGIKSSLAISGNAITSKAADINGDGISDILNFKGIVTTAPPTYTCGESGTDLCGPSILDGFVWEQCLSNGSGSHTCSDVTLQQTNSGVNLWDPASYNLMDVDGDGYADLVLERRVDNKRYMTVCRGGPSGLSTARCWDSAIPATDNVLFQSQFADLNGDGRLDIVLFRNISTSANAALIGIQKQDGTGFNFTTTGFGATDPMLDETELAGKHGLLADIDGDGKVDIIRRMSRSSGLGDGSANPDYARWKTYFSDYSLAGTVAALTPTVRFAEAASDDAPNTHLLDLNGDGLADFASWTQVSNTWKVCLSHGDGSFQFQDPEMKWILPTSTAAGYWQGAGTQTYSTDPAAANFVGIAPRCRTWSGLDLPAAKILWGDFNGDGRSDMAGIVKNASNVNVLNVCTSTGTNFACRVWPVPTGVTLPNVGANISDSLLAGDFNGDGRTDISVKGANGAWTILYAGDGTAKPVDVITKITNGLGATTALTYAPITSASVYTKGTSLFSDTAALSSATTFDVQAPMYVVARVTSSNGLFFANGLIDTTTPLIADYTYSGYRASTKRGPLGFKSKTITENQDTGNIVTTTDFGDLTTDSWQIAGRPKSVTRTVGGTLVSETNYTREVRSHAAGCSSGIANVWQVMNTATQETGYEVNADSPLTIKPFIAMPSRTTSAPMGDTDCYGNPKSVVVAQDGYTQSKAITYTNDASSWILGNVAKSVTTFSKSGLSNIVRTTAATYVPATGAMETQTIEPLAAGETSSPLWNKSTYSYDSYGNRSNVLTQFYEGTELKSRASSAQFTPVAVGDPNYHGRFAVSTTNELGHTSKATYDVAFGNVVKATSPSGHYTQFAYDSFGRKTLETSFTPNGKRLAQTAYNLYPVANFGYAIRSKASGATERRVFYDNLQRERKVETNVTTSGNATVETSTATTNYDRYGRVTTVSQPFAGTGGTSNVKSMTNGYDKFNRAQTVTRQDNGATTSSWSTNGTTLTSTAITTRASTANQITVQRINNSLGWLQTVSEFESDIAKTTTYAYNAAGDMTSVTGPTGIVKEIAYDRLGRKTKLTDPDAGVHEYTYNGLGEIIKQTEGSAATVLRTTDNTYVNGRMTSRVETDATTLETLTTAWTYDSCDSNLAANLTKGALCSVTTARAVNGTADALGAHSRVVGFEPNTGRPFSTRTTVNGKSYVTYSLADINSRPILTAYPNTSLGRALQLKHNYTTSTGQLYNTLDAATNTIYWQADSRYLDGQTYQTKRGATTTTRGYDSAGRLSAIDAVKTAGNAALYSASASFDYIGNVNARGLTVTGVTGAGYTDGFTYDGLNRLKTTTGSSAASYVYDDAGNLTSRGGNLSIAYSPGTHRPCNWTNSAGVTATCTAGVSSNYGYDDTGNFLTSPNHQASWNASGNPHSVRALTALNGATANARLEWRYDASGQRFLERAYSGATSNVDGNGTLVKTTLFLGNGFEEVKDYNASGNVTATTWRHLIASPEGMVALVTHKSSDTAASAQTVRHWHRDHLGSIVVIANENGALTQAFKYDPWGTRTLSTNPSAEATEERGYTSHETLAEIGLVHMNGRLYDPTIGRFLSADPLVQDATQSTSLNRYAYVMNNPMTYTDPSGFSTWTDIRDGFVKPAATLVFAAFAGPIVGKAFEASLGAGFLTNAATATTIGFGSGLIASGGSFEAAFKGAAGGLIGFGIGELIGQLMPAPTQSIAARAGASSAGTTAGNNFDHGFRAVNFSGDLSPTETIGFTRTTPDPSDASRQNTTTFIEGPASRLVISNGPIPKPIPIGEYSGVAWWWNNVMLNPANFIGAGAIATTTVKVAVVGASATATTSAAGSLAGQNLLYKAALQPFGESSLSNAGRALTKHPEVIGTTKNALRQTLRTDASINNAAHAALKDIMRNGVTTKPTLPRYGEVTQVQVPGGFGARWYSDGKFIGFINP